MSIEHLPADSPGEKASEILERDGCVVIDGLLDRDAIDQINLEMADHVETTKKGIDEFGGFETRRTGTLVGRSPKSHEVIMNRTVLDVAARALSHATKFQLHCTEIIAVGPGSKPQLIHRDQWAFDMFPFPPGFDTTLATMWALTDFTEENGATRVIPGSHKRADRLRFEEKDTEAAKMEAGSVLLYTGSLYHGAGANHSDSDRVGLIVHYTLGWLRQEENQYLCVPKKVLQELPEDLLRLMGYDHGGFSLGFIDAGRDPIAAVRPEFEKSTSGIELDEVIEALE
jgi:ectoine hydroxylase-related dioxygenase (phytanoyl-CoA dioxygenase family)